MLVPVLVPVLVSSVYVYRPKSQELEAGLGELCSVWDKVFEIQARVGPRLPCAESGLRVGLRV